MDISLYKSSPRSQSSLSCLFVLHQLKVKPHREVVCFSICVAFTMRLLSCGSGRLFLKMSQRQKSLLDDYSYKETTSVLSLTLSIQFRCNQLRLGCEPWSYSHMCPTSLNREKQFQCHIKDNAMIKLFSSRRLLNLTTLYEMSSMEVVASCWGSFVLLAVPVHCSRWTELNVWRGPWSQMHFRTNLWITT